MFDISWRLILIGLLLAFFFFGGVANIYGPKVVVDDFVRWGYPSWFHLVTGALELVVALLLVFPTSRLFGVGLGSCVMLAAFATLLFHREFIHAIPPLIVVGLLALVVRS